MAKLSWRTLFADPLATLPVGDRQLIKNTVWRVNRRRIPPVLLGLSVWFGIGLILDFAVFLPQGRSYYLIADLTIFPVTLAVAFANAAQEKAIAAYIALLFSWGGVVSALQGSPFTLLILAFLMGATILLGDGSATAVYAISIVTYTGVMIAVHGTPLFHGVALYIEVVALSSAAWLVSRVLFRAQVRASLAENGLKELTREQELRIAEATRAVRASHSELAERLREREVLLREVHHRVMNNLQLLVSLLRLAAGQSENEGAIEVLQDTERRTLAMALVHEHLYANDNIALVDMKAYLRAVANSAVETRSARPAVPVRVDAEAFRAPAEIALNLGLIATEALALALAEAAQKDGSCDQVALRCHHGDNTIELQISGDGCGGAETDTPVREPGLGEILMRTLTDQLKGKLSVGSANGILVTCRVPYPTSSGDRPPT